MEVLGNQIKAVLDSIPNQQYTDGYVDPTGKEGFRNPVREGVGKGLEAIVARLQPQRAVELGTALGRSGLHMALGGLRELHTVEFDAEAAGIAQKNFELAGLDGFRVYHQDSGEFSRDFEQTIDLLFIDHAKPRYLEDLQSLELRLALGGLVLLDNMFNRQPETKDAAAYVADNYICGIYMEPPTEGETTGLMVASKSRPVFDAAWGELLESNHAS